MSSPIPIKFLTLAAIARAYNMKRRDVAAGMHQAGHCNVAGDPNPQAIIDGIAVLIESLTDADETPIYRWNFDIVRATMPEKL